MESGSEKNKHLSLIPFSNSGTLIAWSVLILSLTLTTLFTWQNKLQFEKEEEKQFSFECSEIALSIDARLHAHAQLLRTGAAFFEASDTVSRDDWKTFINFQKLELNLPGVQGVGYAEIIAPEKLAAHTKNIRSQGFADYSVKPAGNRDIYTSIVYLEPFSGRNLRAFGYDMYSEPIRKAAMQRACDNNIASLSGKVMLVQETKTDVQPGTLMYIPVYHHHMPTNTIAERRKAIKGWVYSPYRMIDLMDSILVQNSDKLEKKIKLHIYDSPDIMPKDMLYDSEWRTTANKKETGDYNTKLLHLDFNGKILYLQFYKYSNNWNNFLRVELIIVFFSGTVISILLFLLISAYLNKLRRLRISTEMSRNLKASLDRQLALYNAIPDAVLVTDTVTGQIEDINNRAIEQYEYPYQKFLELKDSDLVFKDKNSDKSETRQHSLFHDHFHIAGNGRVFPVEITQSHFELGDVSKTISIARDITQNIQAETDLKIKNEAFEKSIAAQCVFDEKGIIIYANKAFARIMHFSNSREPAGKHFTTIFNDKILAAIVFKSLDENDSWQGEFTALRPDESTFIAVGFFTTIRNNQGKIIGYQTTNLDRTLEKENENRLLEYKAAIDQAADGIAIANPDLKIRFLNPAWIEMHEHISHEQSEMEVKHFHTNEQFEDEFLPLIALMLETGTASGEIGHKKDDGTTFPTWMSATLLRDRNNEIAGYLFVAHNITQRKKAEAELKKNQERYRKVVENANDIIIVSIPDRVAFANQKFYDLLGYTHDEVDVNSYTMYIHPDDQEELLGRYLKLFEGIPLHKVPARILDKNQNVIWAEFSGIAIDWEGQLAVLSFVSDITQRKKAEDALHASEALYRSTINASPDDITVTDLEGFIQMVSPVALTLIGAVSEDELIGHSILEFIAPEEVTIVAEIIYNMPTLTKKGPKYYKLKRIDGSIFDAEVNGEVIRDSANQSTGLVFIIRDVSERKKAEEALRESEEKWRSLVDNTPDFIALHDKNGNYLFLNHYAEGYSENDIIGKNVNDHLSPETKDLFIEKFNECITSWKPVRFEHKAAGEYGNIKVYDESLVPVLTKNQEINVLAVARDITQQKQWELKLIAQEKHFRQIFEEASIAMALVDKDFHITQINIAFEKYLGYTEEELRNKTFADITVERFIEENRKQLLKLINGEISMYRTEKQYKRKDKTIVWGLVQVSAMHDKNGEITSQLVMINDINDRKAAEESLLKSEEIFNQFMLNSPIYVFFKDNQIRSHRLSRNFEEMIGRPLNELIGKSMYDLFPTELAKKMVADDKKILEEGKQVEIEEELNGHYYTTTKFPIFIDKKPLYLAGYTIDITERKLANDTLRATLKEKEILLREVHHRVKNNLQVVSSLLNLQSDKSENALMKEILMQSRNRIRSIALVHEKLYQTGNFAEINFREYAISLTHELFRAYAADPAKIHVRTLIEDVNIPLIYAIPCGLILNEIISNSLKYAFPENREKISQPEIIITIKTLPDNNLQILAGDNGIGLPDTYTPTDTTSLGLYLIHILATEQLDGTISVNNKKGTTFTITFNPFQK